MLISEQSVFQTYASCINVLVVYLMMLFSLVCCALFLLLHWPQNLKKLFPFDSFDSDPTLNRSFTWNESNMIFTWHYCKSNGFDNDTLFGSTLQSYNTLVEEPFSIPPCFLQFIVLREFWKVHLSTSIWNFMRKLCQSLQILRLFFFFPESPYLDNRF